jgi:hypothetical protein
MKENRNNKLGGGNAKQVAKSQYKISVQESENQENRQKTYKMLVAPLS